jgi:NAD(P)-dependent dehydrogenase (short-subunit alcohol dehydrogenase family)
MLWAQTGTTVSSLSSRVPLPLALPHRVRVYGLDLRDLAAVERFCVLIKLQYGHLDFLINNAAQTVRRPPKVHGMAPHGIATVWFSAGRLFIVVAVVVVGVYCVHNHSHRYSHSHSH